MEIKNKIVSLGLIASFVGCASSGVKNIPIPELPKTTNVSDEMTRQEVRLREAKQNEMDVFAPHYFNRSVKSLNEAREDQRSGKDVDSILRKLSESEAYLNKGIEISQVSRSALGQVADARDMAIQAGAPEYAKDKYKETEKKLFDIVSDAENGKTDSALSNQSKLVKEYKQAEMDAVLEKNLGHSLATIESAKKEGARDWAPRALLSAERSYVQAKNAIMNNPEDKQTIESLASQAQQNADYLLTTTQRAKQIKARPPEETAAYIENEQKKLQAFEQKTNEAQTSLSEQNKKIQELEAKQSMEKKIAQVSTQFKPSEAEVIRQNDSVVIRLKGLNFAKSKATIPPADFPLLKKIELTINELGPANVKVIGNTDSKGTKAVNKVISQKRADAVKSYLTSDPSLTAKSVEAIGVGDENPIASNKTATGRELNRRVDIVIQPAPGGVG